MMLARVIMCCHRRGHSIFHAITGSAVFSRQLDCLADILPVGVLLGDVAVAELPEVAARVGEGLAANRRAAHHPLGQRLVGAADPVLHLLPPHVGDLMVAAAQDLADLLLAAAAAAFGRVGAARHQPFAVLHEVRQDRVDVMAVEAVLDRVEQRGGHLTSHGPNPPVPSF